VTTLDVVRANSFIAENQKWSEEAAGSTAERRLQAACLLCLTLLPLVLAADAGT
jgi:hypothetical protein